MPESWLPVPGYDGLYEVSDHGRVRNSSTGLVLRSRPDKDGYRLVSLYSGGAATKSDKKVHRLVLFAFVGPPPEGAPETDHKDRDKANNNIANLIWSSIADNRRNIAPRGASGVQGVRYRDGKLNPWQAYTCVRKRFISVGHYATMAAAKAARETFVKGIIDGVSR